MQLLNPERPPDGNNAIADQAFRLFCSKVFKVNQMAFVNEMVSDEDIAKYKLPFALGSKCYWTKDSMRNLFFWGEISADPARGYLPEGRFFLILESRLLAFVLGLGNGSTSFRDNPYRIVWKEIIRVQPADFAGLDPQMVIPYLKEALSCFGYDGRRNIFAPNLVVAFEF